MRINRSSVFSTQSAAKLGFAAALILMISSSALAAQWAPNEDPAQFLYQDEKLETHLDKLRLSAKVDETGGHIPWSETYWPANKGGIAIRYLEGGDQNSEAFSASHPSLKKLRDMSEDEIRRLSATEKFDIAKSEYHYPLTARVLAQYKESDPQWWGICHGWTPAAVNYPEPLPMTITNKEGITIPFGASDVKALISYYYAWEVSQVNDKNEMNWGYKDEANGAKTYWQKDPRLTYFIYRQLGQRCFKSGCKKTNMNPASFHLALTNLVGNYQRSFVVNVDASQEVWNQPVYGYESRELDEMAPSKDAIDGTVREVLFNTKLTYVDETSPSFAANGKKVSKSKKTLAYWLFIDANGNVIGGRWSKGLFRRPSRRTSFIGFAWRASRVPFAGDFEILNKLYKPSSHKSMAYTTGKNYTPGLEDTYFYKNASTLE